jgi:uncharacterized membrane protein
MTALEQRAAGAGRSPISFKRLAWLTLGLLTLATLYVHETPLLKASDPEWPRVWPFRWWLLPHVATGAVSLALGPLQFSASLRRRSLALHRWLGRVYVAATLVAAGLALYIVMVFEAPANRWVMGVMAGLWWACTALAWLAIRGRDIAQHRLWMMRSYGLTFTFVTTRFIPDVVLPGLGFFGVTTLYWLLILLALVLPDVIVFTEKLRARPIFPSRA